MSPIPNFPKPVGLIGGMSWESTQTYYQILNRETQARLGGTHSAHVLLQSLDFAWVEALQVKHEWDEMARMLTASALTLERAGAGLVLICTNTMHKVAPQVEAALSVPLLHIAHATALALKQDEIKKVGLLGTAYTMEMAFYKDRLIQDHGIDVIIPNADDRQLIHDIIFKELVRGIIRPESREIHCRITEDLAQQGAQAVILGCTEIGLLLTPEFTRVPLYDTAQIHALAAVDWSLG